MVSKAAQGGPGRPRQAFLSWRECACISDLMCFQVFSKDLSGFLRNIDAKVVFEGPEKNRESTSQQTNANKHSRKELWLARGSIVSHSSNESTGRP